MGWTSQQEQAIAIRNRGCIVSAAAGSGKTSVLVERLLRILMEQSPEHRVPADRMIVVTFTNDAAAEMRSRLYQAIAGQLQKNPENTWLYQQQILLQSAHICTISSFCFDLIRDNVSKDGITADFRILNETESKMIQTRALEQLLDEWEQIHPEKMKMLWSCFCEKNFLPLQNLILDLHQYLVSVPFRNAWCRSVLESYQQIGGDSEYCRFFDEHLQQDLSLAVCMAQEAEEIALTMYDDVQENTVYPWIRDDLHCLRQVQERIGLLYQKPEQVIAPLLEKKRKRQNKNFPRKKKTIISAEAYEQVKQLRICYEKLEGSILELVQYVIPYVTADLEKHSKIVPVLFEMEQELSDRIWMEKVRKNALSFEDGERLALELLSEQTEDGKILPSVLAKELQSYYQLIMIDEYQDSNNKQDDIFKLLSRNCIDPHTHTLRYGDNVFLVGDVKQSIYRFRLANPQNFIGAIADAKTENSVCRHIVLNRNFRSVPSVLYFVNFVCGCLMSPSCGEVAYTQDEALQPGSSIGDMLDGKAQGVEIAVLQQESSASDVQISYLIGNIKKMIAEKVPVAEKNGNIRPCTYSDFCILLRNNVICVQVAHALEEAGIPVQSPEEKGYLQSREISVLLDILRVVDNPLLDTSLAAVMLSPIFWFTADELLQVRKLAKKSSLYYAVEIAVGVAKAECNDRETLSVVLQQKCRMLYDTLHQIRQSVDMVPLDLLIRYIYDTTDFLSVMQLTKNGDRKRANLYLLLQYAKQYTENADASHYGVSGFLRYIDWLLESGNDFQQSGASAGNQNAVSVKTMHKSKGLEYPFVFLAKLETKFSTEDLKKNALFSDNGMMGMCLKEPDTYTRAVTFPYTVLQQENQMRSKSEELRLLYVAMTRAKQKLFIPLLKNKLVTKQKKYLYEYAAMIADNGTLTPYMVQSASSMAQWLWMCLLLRHDAELADCLDLPQMHWRRPAWEKNLQISYVFETVAPEEETEEKITEWVEDVSCTSHLRQLVQFTYESESSTLESLLSVSEIQEVQSARAPIWKRPKFIQDTHKLTGAERGTAIHTFFQYASFANAERDVTAEIQRLQRKGFLTDSQAQVVSPKLVEKFFGDPIYQRMRASSDVLREHKFLVKCRDLCSDELAAKILHRYRNSDSMLKGIIDLSFREKDGYVLVDYKTDVVPDGKKLLQEYREQLLLYRAALQCITGVPVYSCYLYSTHLGKSIELPIGK